jgi:ADP-heptose:LPS heptosyltransferase
LAKAAPSASIYPQKTLYDLKKWPHWDVFLKQLLNKTTFTLLLVGSPEEAKEVTPLISARIESLVGQTTLPELLRLIQSAQCVIGVDSGPIHWADYLEVPTLGLYGPTSPLSWGLLGPTSRTLSHSEHCSPCYRDDGHFPQCPFHKKCMLHLQPERVLQQLEQLIPSAFNL